MHSTLIRFSSGQAKGSWLRGAIIKSFLAATLAAGALDTSAALPPGPSPAPGRAGMTNSAARPVAPAITNRPPRTASSLLPPRTNAPAMKGPAVTSTNRIGGTNAAAAKPGTSVTNAPAAKSLKARIEAFRSHPYFSSIVVAIISGILVLILVIRALLRRRAKAPTSSAAAAAAQSKGPANVSSCNVLSASDSSRRLYSFDARSHGFALNKVYNPAPGQTLPQHVVARSWTSLFQKKLNVAWLSPDQVFLKVLQLPRSSHPEMVAMVELQVEKLSPMPLAQVVWSIQVLPRPEGSLDTVIVMIVARSVVEEYLGRLETEGYLPHTLELGVLDQLQATPIKGDGAYIYPNESAANPTALVAWYYGGTLQNLDLAVLPPENRAASLREQLSQMAWAGEMEGWITSPPNWHLIATQENVALWEPPLREGLEHVVETLDPLPEADLAARTATRSARANSSGLMPPEFIERYRQQFIDRLWMRGLLAVLGLYIFGIAVFFIALGVKSYKSNAIESRVEQLGPTYTSALQLKAQARVLQDRMDLKYAALDCWSIVAQNLPEGVTLDSLNFTDGKRLTLMGTAPVDKTTALLDFEAALRKATVNGEPLFGKTDNISYNANPGGNTVVWNLTAELHRTEVQ